MRTARYQLYARNWTQTFSLSSEHGLAEFELSRRELVSSTTTAPSHVRPHQHRPPLPTLLQCTHLCCSGRRRFGIAPRIAFSQCPRRSSDYALRCRPCVRARARWNRGLRCRRGRRAQGPAGAVEGVFGLLAAEVAHRCRRRTEVGSGIVRVEVWGCSVRGSASKTLRWWGSGCACREPGRGAKRLVLGCSGQDGWRAWTERDIWSRLCLHCWR